MQVALEAQGATLEVKVLSVMEFSSDRKRMSVLARLPGGTLRLYTKVKGPSRTEACSRFDSRVLSMSTAAGLLMQQRPHVQGADTMLLPLLAAGQQEAVATLQRHLADMSRSGLRTLIIAQRHVSAAEYEVS